ATFRAVTWQASGRHGAAETTALTKVTRACGLAAARADQASRSSRRRDVRCLFELRIHAHSVRRHPVDSLAQRAAAHRAAPAPCLPLDRRELTMTSETLSAHTSTCKSVAVVTRHLQLEVLDVVLDAGDYGVVLVESIDRAYSCIRRVMPDLVILCLEMDDVESFQLLSMLQLDRETAEIPVRTFVVRPDAVDRDRGGYGAGAIAPQSIAASMN